MCAPIKYDCGEPAEIENFLLKIAFWDPQFEIFARRRPTMVGGAGSAYGAPKSKYRARQPPPDPAGSLKRTISSADQ